MNRRRLLRSAAGLTVGAAAGCLDTVLRSVPDGIDCVPERADGVLYLDVSGILADEAVERVVEAYLAAQSESPDYQGPTNYEGYLSSLENEYTIDLRRIQEATAFWTTERGDFIGDIGVIVRLDSSLDDLLRALEHEGRSAYEEQEYEGVQLLRPTDEHSEEWVGVLSSEQVVVGTERAVTDVIDVVETDASSIEGDLRDAFEAMSGDPVRMVSRVPDPGATDTEDIRHTLMDDVSRMHGSISRDGSERTLSATLLAHSTEDAAAAKTTVEDFLSDLLESADERLTNILEDTQIDAVGDQVRIDVTQEISTLETLFEEDDKREFSLRYEETFETIPVGGFPEDWSGYDDHYETLEVHRGGAAGTDKALRMTAHTCNGDNDQDWVRTPQFDFDVRKIELYWKKREDGQSPELRVDAEQDDSIVVLKLSDDDIQIRHLESFTLVEDVFALDEFHHVELEFHEQGYSLYIDGSEVSGWMYPYPRDVIVPNIQQVRVKCGDSDLDEMRVYS